MSQMLKAAQLLDGLKQNAIDAWDLTDKTVHFGNVVLPVDQRKYAIINLQAVEMGSLAVRTVYQNYVFNIRARMPFPETGNILLYKIAQANLLIGEIITGADYLGLAHLPYITSFDPTEDDDPQNRYLEFTVDFSCQVEEDHH